ncbi:ATP-binding protein [Anaeroselena agilis]|uniref:histidine kinase n=1 Tax=Anaeroselena agilis TaxID=3063788 RepID=A0ABU3P3D0_9FIRM|nr:sensor histidine kinase KdpD [Selenomonadales bacterium 4137-cl]
MVETKAEKHERCGNTPPRVTDKARRGKLTVFLGAAAGVGMTVAMLEKARALQQANVDIVIGWIDPHGQPELQRLLAGMRKIPDRVREYKAASFAELDVDSIILRKPTVVVIDELARANAPGSRHTKRFQDVEDLLAAGINVFTTLDIRNIESLSETAARITGAGARETVPDYFVEQADTVTIVDVSPEELIRRYKEGRLWLPPGTVGKPDAFFRPETINALRGLLFRLAAERECPGLGKRLKECGSVSVPPAAGRVMVCVDATPFSVHLIRAGRRLASSLGTEWLAVHIDTVGSAIGSGGGQVAENMRLAEELGAKTLIITAKDVVGHLADTARSNNVAAVVVGRACRGPLRRFLSPGVADKLAGHSLAADIYVVRNPHEAGPAAPPVSLAPPAGPQSRLHYAGCAMMVAAITALGWLLRNHLELMNIVLLYQIPVVLSAFWWGRWPSYFTAVCSVLVFNFIFVPPVFAIRVYDRFVLSFITFVVVSYVVGRRTEVLRDEAAAARQRERSTRAMFDFSRAIAAVIDLDTIVSEFISQATDALRWRIAVFMPDEKGQLQKWDDRQAPAGCDKNEAAAAQWAYTHRQSAGKSTDTMPDADCLYLPLATVDATVGVLAVDIDGSTISPEQRRLLETWAGLASIALERVRLTERAREAALLLESERLRTALINSVSHELRTPLSLIIGSSSTLLETEATFSAGERRELLENIKHGANRMDRVVANLLDAARLESGLLQLKTDWCDIEDIIGAALRRFTDQIKDRPLTVAISPDTPLLRGDCVLLEQVMVNLIDNATKYSPPGSQLEITASVVKDKIAVTVADHGIGIPEPELVRIFDKFYRIQHREGNIGGTGLGLAICKSILEAHGGTIKAENRPGGGASFTFDIPINDNTSFFQSSERRELS